MVNQITMQPVKDHNSFSPHFLYIAPSQILGNQTEKAPMISGETHCWIGERKSPVEASRRMDSVTLQQPCNNLECSQLGLDADAATRLLSLIWKNLVIMH